MLKYSKGYQPTQQMKKLNKAKEQSAEEKYAQFILSLNYTGKFTVMESSQLPELMKQQTKRDLCRKACLLPKVLVRAS